MTQEIEQLDIFSFLDNSPAEGSAEEVAATSDETVAAEVSLIGRRLLIVDETKFPPFIKNVRMGYRTGMTATVVGGFCGIIDILLDKEHWETEPRRIPSSIGLLACKIGNGAIELIEEGKR